ncbi:MAG: terminase small subunit protein [Patescibacteria group bacterium]|nr:terminase small subunit protein [Patescibacteria group bacterium]
MAKTPSKAKPARCGRPSLYSPEIGERICTLIASGHSLRAIGDMPGMPDKATILRWLVGTSHPEFCDQYARARELQAEGAADEMLEIADDGRNDFIKREIGEGTEVEVFNSEHVQRSKLRLDTRKWLLSKLLPKKYGDKLTQEITGRDGGPITSVMAPTKIEFEIIDHTAHSDSPGVQTAAGERPV